MPNKPQSPKLPPEDLNRPYEDLSSPPPSEEQLYLSGLSPQENPPTKEGHLFSDDPYLKTKQKLQSSVDLSMKLENFMTNLELTAGRIEKMMEGSIDKVIGRINTYHDMYASQEKSLTSTLAIQERQDILTQKEAKLVEAQSDAKNKLNEIERMKTYELRKQLDVYGLIDKQHEGGSAVRITDKKGNVRHVLLRDAIEQIKTGKGESAEDLRTTLLREIRSRGVLEEQPGYETSRIKILQQAVTGRTSATDALLQIALRGGIASGVESKLGALFEKMASTGPISPIDRIKRALPWTSTVPETDIGGGIAAGEGRGGGIISSLGEGALARSIPFLISRAFTPLAVIEFIRHVFPTIMGQINQARQLGHLTGEGFGAGIAARLEAPNIGWNPFDMVSMRTAREIVGGVRGQGFRGETAKRMEETIKDLTNAGIDWKDSLELGTIAVRESDQSITDFHENMKKLSEVARETGSSLDITAKSLAEYAKATVPIAGPGALQDAEAIQRTFGRVFGKAEFMQTGSLMAAITKQMQIITAKGGGDYLAAGEPGQTKFLLRGIENIRNMARQAEKSMMSGISPSYADSFQGRNYFITTQLRSGFLDSLLPGISHQGWLQFLWGKGSDKGLIKSYERESAEVAITSAESVAHEHKRRHSGGFGVFGRLGDFAIRASLGPVGIGLAIADQVGILPGPHLPAGGLYVGGHWRGGKAESEKALYDDLKKTLATWNIAASEQNRLLAPLKKAKSEGDFEKAAKKAEEQIIWIRMHPEVSRYFAANNSGYNSAIYGRQSSIDNVTYNPLPRP